MKNWTTWIPLLTAILISICANLFPIFMAFVLEADGWKGAGFVLYLFILPASIVLIVVGLILSLIISSKRKDGTMNTSTEQIYEKVPKARLEEPNPIDYPGYGRLAFFGLWIIAILSASFIAVLLAPSMAFTAGVDSQVDALGTVFGMIGTAIAGFPRLRNLGYTKTSSAFQSFLFLVPVVALVVYIPCIAYPTGYKDHKTLDTPARIIRGILIALIIIIVALIAIAFIAA